uniref:Uncharacterized protein n=1 Tax=Setaria italica TaxID=4555 RepID=K3XN71_SETIT
MRSGRWAGEREGTSDSSSAARWPRRISGFIHAHVARDAHDAVAYGVTFLLVSSWWAPSAVGEDASATTVMPVAPETASRGSGRDRTSAATASASSGSVAAPAPDSTRRATEVPARSAVSAGAASQ